MAFNNYLEDENDKPYFTTNSLAYYYDKMEGFAKAVEGSAKALNLTKEEVEKRLTLYIEQNKNVLDQRLAQWDGKLETFDSSVETLLTEWVDDGTLTPLIDSTLIDQRLAPLAGQLADTAKKTALEIERKRIDNLLSVEPGVDNAETTDIRVGADGITYDTAGASVRSQFEQVNNDLSASGAAVKSKVMVANIPGADGFIDLNGVFQATSSWKTTDFISAANVANLSLYIKQASNILSISYYDKDKLFISGQSGSATATTTVKANFPVNAEYYRTSWVKSDLTQYYVLSQSDILLHEKEIETLKTRFETFPVTNRVNISEVTGDGSYVDVNGVRQASASFVTTVAIDCRDIVSLRINVQQYLTVMYASFYDKGQTFISGIVGKSSELFTGDVPIPTEAVFLKLSFIKSNSKQWYEITRNSIKKQLVDTENKLNPLFGKVLVSTGDSINTTTSFRPYSGFSRMIALKNQMIHESHAIWGATLPVNAASSGSILATIPNMRNDADYIILSGGVNDWYHLKNGNEVLGVITEAYDAPLDETTFYGALEKACKLATEKWAGKKVIYVITHKILDIPASDYKIIDGYVSGMKKILEKWGVPYVDLYNTVPSLFLPSLKNAYTTNGNAAYTGVGDGLHPNKAGYEIYYNPKVEALLKSV